jgi:hypothetical protein
MKEKIPEAASKLQEVNGDYAHFRGTFENPRVLIVADPHGYDDLITSRALTGTRGQYWQGVMNDLGVKEKYLVLKTAPYSRVETNLTEWNEIVELTKPYREHVLTALVKESAPEVIIADGEDAIAEVARILGDSKIRVINVDRRGGKADEGIMAAASELEKVSGFRGRALGKMADIPRVHLPFYSRIWEGTSGDRVLTSTNAKWAGKAFIEVAPNWATKQKYEFEEADQLGVKALIQSQKENGLPQAADRIDVFMRNIRE